MSGIDFLGIMEKIQSIASKDFRIVDIYPAEQISTGNNCILIIFVGSQPFDAFIIIIEASTEP